MSTFEKPLGSLTLDDLQGLIEGKVLEGRQLEYKEKLPGNSDADKREFLADVSSFANSAGGDLLYGIAENDGLPDRLVGLDTSMFGQEQLRLESIIRDGLQPRLMRVSFHAVVLTGNSAILVVRVPRSHLAPHMVTFNNLSRFFGRNSKEKYQLDVTELRSAFLAGSTSRQVAREWRLLRIERILAGETPVRLDPRPKVALYCVPLSTVLEDFALDPLQVAALDNPPSPLHSSRRDYRYNLDGVVFYGQPDRSASAHAYLQVFRNGSLETVASSLIDRDPPRNYIRSVPVEGALIDALGMYLATYQQLEISSPIAVMISLLGVRGFQVLPRTENRSWDSFRHPLTEENLLLPDIVVNDTTIPPDQLLRPAFDVMWQAAGWERSLNYGEVGERLSR